MRRVEVVSSTKILEPFKVLIAFKGCIEIQNGYFSITYTDCNAGTNEPSKSRAKLLHTRFKIVSMIQGGFIAPRLGLGYKNLTRRKNEKVWYIRYILYIRKNLNMYFTGRPKKDMKYELDLHP